MSAYLAAAHSGAGRGYASWRRTRNRAFVIWRGRPHITFRTGLALLSWVLLFGVGLFAFQHRALIAPAPSVLAADHSLGAAIEAAQHATAPAVKLPGGPSGQLLPPGTMAAPYTYANSYARGQCTWYVAGRRPVPSGWGNAANWYYAAQRAGWSTGTTPAVAAIAWTPRGYYGHVALVEGVDTSTGRVLISEMNYYGPYRTDQRWAPISDFKYIY